MISPLERAGEGGAASDSNFISALDAIDFGGVLLALEKAETVGLARLDAVAGFKGKAAIGGCLGSQL